MKKRTFAIIGSAVALVTVTGSVLTIYAKAATKVDSYTVAKSDISEVIELNGNVASSVHKTYFTDVNLKVKEVNVKVGDTVKKGDILATFDEDEIETAIALANCTEQANNGSYDNAIQMSNRNANLYNEAIRTLNILNTQIKETEEAIFAKQEEINKRSSELASEGKNLSVSIVSENPGSEEYNNLQKQIQTNSYYQSYDEKLVNLQAELARLNVQLADFKEHKAIMESQKAANQTAMLTDGAKNQLNANKEASAINTASTIEKLENAKGGIVAEFDGVIASVDISEGSLVAPGQSLISMDSSKDIIIACNANKYDIINIEEGQTTSTVILGETYTGKISRINKYSAADAAQGIGVGVEITLDDPSDDIIIGFEVKSKVNTANVNDVICVPKKAITTDDDGSYVFVAGQDNKANKRSVEIGIDNDDYAEITAGVSEGDVIIWNENTELKDGADVRIAQ